MKAYIFVSLLIVAVSASLEEQGEKFQTFKLEHGKAYSNQVEETKRFSIFKDNLRAIEEHNALYDQGLVSYKQGINQFSDLTQEEFLARLTLSKSQKPVLNITSEHIQTELDAPKSIDWRKRGYVTKVKDQGQCGSCWAFSVVGSTEGAYKRKSGKLVSLSEQQLVDCSTDINHGCSGGYLDETFPYIHSRGLESERDYPYTGSDGSCKFNARKVVTKVSRYTSIRSEDERALRDAVGKVGPVSVALDASSLALYSSGIYHDERCSPNYLNHGVLIVGYGSEHGHDYWIVKNSWGSSWGENGYFRIVRGANECGIAKDSVYPTIR